MSLRRLRNQWESLACEDPLWAILSDPARRGGKWDLHEFFATGEREILEALEHLERLGVSPASGRALDFGCGVGRLTQALASRFARADGVDVSLAMVAQARGYNRFAERCVYHHNDTPGLPFAQASFDLVYSNVVLQHIPGRLARGYIREFVRVLKPGGVALFQEIAEPAPHLHDGAVWRRLCRAAATALPERAADALRDARRQLTGGAPFGLYGVPRVVVEEILGKAGACVIEVVEDGAAGEGWVSLRYCAVKEGILADTTPR